jgi:cystathionine beta-lyase/cystathionine gamma-synthase
MSQSHRAKAAKKVREIERRKTDAGPEMEQEPSNYSLTYSSTYKGYRYNRSNHDLMGNVCKELSNCHTNPRHENKGTINPKLQMKDKWFQTDQVVLATSGINAIAMAFKLIMFENRFKLINILYSKELYCDTPRYIKYFNKLYGVSNIRAFDVLDPEGLKRLFSRDYNDQVNILFIESCSNPNGNIFDMSEIPKLRELSKKLYVIVDNTWLTHVTFNPFEFDVDIVVSSMSKHYSLGKCISGFVVLRNRMMANNLHELNKMEGIHIPLPYCQIILDSLSKMDECVELAYVKTLQVAQYLESNKNVVKVNYPMLESHPSHELAKKYFRFGPTILTFAINLRKPEAKRWMKGFKTIPFKTSFGSEETKLDPWPYEIDGITYCRLAIGYNTNVEELIKDFTIALSKMK